MMRWFWPLSHLGSWWLDLSTWQYMIKLINLAVDEGMILHHWSTWRLMRGMKQWWWRGPLVVKENGHVKWPFVLEWWWRLTASHMWRETSFPCDDGERQFSMWWWWETVSYWSVNWPLNMREYSRRRGWWGQHSIPKRLICFDELHCTSPWPSE